MTLTLSPPAAVEAPAAPAEDRIWLRSDDDFSRSVNSALFEEMVRRAVPHMTHHQGDLFHDAVWMEHYITGPSTFYWAHRDMGTQIGADLDAVTAFSGGSITFYRIDLEHDERGRWSALFTPITPERRTA